MFSLKEFIEKLSEKSEKERKKILWKSVAALGFFLFILFAFQVKSNFFKEKKLYSLPETNDLRENFQDIGDSFKNIKESSDKNLKELKKLNENLKDLEKKAEEERKNRDVDDKKDTNN